MQIKTTSTYACLLTPFLVFLFSIVGLNQISARTFTTVANGSYENRLVWDLGMSPGANDTIIVNHDVITSSGLGYGPGAELTVNAGGTMRINGSLTNRGKIYIYGSIDVFGNCNNTGEIFVDAGRKLEVLGDFTNDGLITNNGIVIVQGAMTNNSTAVGTGHYDVCGITTNNGHAEPSLTLCQICGEKYFNFGTGTYTELCGSLPVVLNYFTATPGDGFVKLNWETETESNSDYFIVQRTDINGEFQDILKVNSAGNSTEKRQYEAADLAPLPGEAIYRLLNVDKNGQIQQSDNVTVTYELSLEPELKIYPNPSNGIVNLRFQEVPQGDIIIRVMDLSGSIKKEVTTDPYAELDLSLDLSNLPNGYYILHGAYAGGSVSQKVLLF